MLDRRTLIAAGLTQAGLALSGCSDRKRAGFSSDGLSAIRAKLEQAVASGTVPGLVASVARGQDVQAFVVGHVDTARSCAMQRDSIFRIASMTKPITAAAVMMLIEQGKFRLDEPVDRLLPELANRRVLRRVDGALDETVPADRPITIQDLLTFRCGWGLVLDISEQAPFQKAVKAFGGVGFGPPDPTVSFDGDGWLERLRPLPLLAQPGQRFLYTTGSDIQGVLVARASGMPLSQFLAERIFAPLGMRDTGFFAPSDTIQRLVPAYQPQGDRLNLLDPAAGGGWSRPPRFEQGDSGLVSTVDDFLSFARMMLAKGAYPGGRLLSRESVEAMTANHLSASQRASGAPILEPGRGWGYGMSVLVEDVSRGPQSGSFGWNGGFGTSWLSDPHNDLTMILLTQRLFTAPSGDPLHGEFQASAYAALA